jgi:hypothetical protein
MTKIMIVILTYHRHKPIDVINSRLCLLVWKLCSQGPRVLSLVPSRGHFYFYLSIDVSMCGIGRRTGAKPEAEGRCK